MLEPPPLVTAADVQPVNHAANITPIAASAALLITPPWF
jgi:hypothetical protein